MNDSNLTENVPATRPKHVPRECCDYCGRSIQMFDAVRTDDGLVHLGCQELTGRPHDTRTSRRREYAPDFQAPAMAQQEYIRQTAFCYATLFHNPIKRPRIKPRFRYAK